MKLKLALFGVLFIAGIFFLNIHTEKENSLKFGMMSGWAPFMTINQQGLFEGFDVDVAEEIAKRLGQKSQILDMGSLAPLFVALQTNKIDMILSGLDITNERLKKLDMIPYCGENIEEYYLLFWQKIPENINNIADLKNYPDPVVVVEPGVSAEKLIDNYGFITKKQIAALPDRVLDVQYGKSLAMLLEPSVARSLMVKNTNLKALPVKLPQELQIFGMGIATKKDSALSKRIEDAIRAMKKDGTLEKLQAKWGLSEKAENNDEV